MSAREDKNYQPRRFRAEVKKAGGRKRAKDGQQNPEAAAPETAAVQPQETAAVTEPAEAAAQPSQTAAEPVAADRDEPVQQEQISAAAADTEAAEEGSVDPDTVFDYVVPTETFKQHAKRKHKSTHSGKTKIATEEEMEEAVDGYIFMSRKKGKKRKSHHRHHRWRHLALWKKIVIIVVAVILALLIALAGTYLVLNEIGRRGMHHYDEIEIVPPTEDESGNDVIAVDNSGRVITYDGISYEFNDDILSIAFIGADEGSGTDAGLNMADAIYILTVDAKTGKVVILGISRDTMADVDLYSAAGRYIDTERMQMAYSYAYGNDSVTGGQNTATSLSRLFFGLPLENYFAINMNALTTLNDTIGGVTLTSSMTFTSPIDGRTIYEGDTVTLHGKEAEYYVRTRDISQLDSNNDRMQRQQEYIRAFISSIVPAAKQDLSTVTNLYNEININSETNLDLPKMTYIASTALTKLNSAADIQYVSLLGEITEGEHAEMNITDEAAIRTMLDIFYKPLAEVPSNED